MNPRPVSITHLVLGLVFAGIALLWLADDATGWDLPSPEVSGPALLIGAGVVGLVVSMVGVRRRNDAAKSGHQTDRPDQPDAPADDLTEEPR